MAEYGNQNTKNQDSVVIPGEGKARIYTVTNSETGIIKTYVDDKLIVKHLRPTSKRYEKNNIYNQGKLMYRLRYGIIISLIASLKLSWKKRKIKFLLHCILGYLKASKKKNDFLISKKQGLFIRNYRLKNIVKKIFLLS